MMPATRSRVSKLTLLNISYSLPHLYQSLTGSHPSVAPQLMRLRSLSSIDGSRPPFLRREEQSSTTSHRPLARGTTQSAGSVIANGDEGEDARERMYREVRQNPPNPIPNRPLRGEKPVHQSNRLPQRKFNLGGKDFDDDDDDDGAGGYRFEKSMANSNTNQKSWKSSRVAGGNRTSRQSGSNLFQLGKFGNDYGEEKIGFDKEDKQGDAFLEKFKLGFDKEEKLISNAANPQPRTEEGTKGEQAVPEPLPPPQDADEIFKRMKEAGLIPNAVAMLDGLCKDGLVQEAMKLFGLMREKGTIPEVVIYTAVVEGFCKAHKLDDAKRIFRKMQNNGIAPNAFSYAVLIQGLCKGKRLEDALDFCVEMLEAGHSPNLASFTGLVDGFCREKGLDEARSIIGALRQKGLFFDEKTVREYLDKKGPFLPLVWEAILGKKSSNRPF